MDNNGHVKKTLVFRIHKNQNFDDLEIKESYSNYIADLNDLKLETLQIIQNNLVIFGRLVYQMKGSFVVVAKHDFDENLNIVPTLTEAYDLIEMEEIERELET